MPVGHISMAKEDDTYIPLDGTIIIYADSPYNGQELPICYMWMKIK